MASVVSSLADTIRLIPGYDPYATAGESWFDEDAAQRAIDFFGHPKDGCLRHVEGAKRGELFVLEPWQQAIIANLFGWKMRDSFGRVARRYREAFLFVPRKNGKTPLIAGMSLFVLFCDDESGQQNYCAAADREQAGFLFRHAKGMVDLEPELSGRCRVYGGNAAAGQSKSIVREDEGSFLRVISADADTKHGGNSHFIVIDEEHTQPNRDLVDVLQTSMASANRKQPLIVHVTTAGFDRNSICYEKYIQSCQVRDGIINDPAFLPVIYEAKPDADWKDEATWFACNPNLGVSVSLEYLKRECQRAIESPAYQNTFKRLHLNIWTEQDTRWLDMDKWDACGTPFDVSDFEGQPCFAGLDLASTTDIAALVLVFPVTDQIEGVKYAAISYFWIPIENARSRELRDRVPYSQWIREGFIKATGENRIDYDVIREDVRALAERFDIKEIAIDRWNSTQLQTQLAGDGLAVVQFGQGFASMSAPTKELDRLVASGELGHGGNPVMRWMAANVSVEQDAAGNMKPSKKKSREKIDGIVSLVMAIGRALLRLEDDGGACLYV